jgi:hypothetical protein
MPGIGSKTMLQRVIKTALFCAECTARPCPFLPGVFDLLIERQRGLAPQVVSSINRSGRKTS